MKLKNVIKFFELYDNIVIHLHYNSNNTICCEEFAYEGTVERIPWVLLDYELYNDFENEIYGISARNYGEKEDTQKAGFIINLFETD